MMLSASWSGFDSYCVYGLRLKTEREVRYIGMSRRGASHRLAQHIYGAASKEGTPFVRWLSENRDNIEVFIIADRMLRDEAKAFEKETILGAAKLGQRLFNRTHVPAESREAA